MMILHSQESYCDIYSQNYFTEITEMWCYQYMQAFQKETGENNFFSDVSDCMEL